LGAKYRPPKKKVKGRKQYRASRGDDWYEDVEALPGKDSRYNARPRKVKNVVAAERAAVRRAFVPVNHACAARRIRNKAKKSAAYLADVAEYDRQLHRNERKRNVVKPVMPKPKMSKAEEHIATRTRAIAESRDAARVRRGLKPLGVKAEEVHAPKLSRSQRKAAIKAAFVAARDSADARPDLPKDGRDGGKPSQVGEPYRCFCGQWWTDRRQRQRHQCVLSEHTNLLMLAILACNRRAIADIMAANKLANAAVNPPKGPPYLPKNGRDGGEAPTRDAGERLKAQDEPSWLASGLVFAATAVAYGLMLETGDFTFMWIPIVGMVMGAHMWAYLPCAAALMVNAWAAGIAEPAVVIPFHVLGALAGVVFAGLALMGQVHWVWACASCVWIHSGHFYGVPVLLAVAVVRSGLHARRTGSRVWAIISLLLLGAFAALAVQALLNERETGAFRERLSAEMHLLRRDYHTHYLADHLPESGALAAAFDKRARAFARGLRALGGWIRDLTEEGVEPNPGPKGSEAKPKSGAQSAGGKEDTRRKKVDKGSPAGPAKERPKRQKHGASASAVRELAEQVVDAEARAAGAQDARDEKHEERLRAEAEQLRRAAEAKRAARIVEFTNRFAGASAHHYAYWTTSRARNDVVRAPKRFETPFDLYAAWVHASITILLSLGCFAYSNIGYTLLFAAALVAHRWAPGARGASKAVVGLTIVLAIAGSFGLFTSLFASNVISYVAVHCAERDVRLSAPVYVFHQMQLDLVTARPNAEDERPDTWQALDPKFDAFDAIFEYSQVPYNVYGDPSGDLVEVPALPLVFWPFAWFQRARAFMPGRLAYDTARALPAPVRLNADAEVLANTYLPGVTYDSSEMERLTRGVLRHTATNIDRARLRPVLADTAIVTKHMWLARVSSGFAAYGEQDFWQGPGGQGAPGSRF